MKKLIILTMMVLFLGFAATSQAFNLQTARIDPKDQAVITLLAMIGQDLQMCGTSLRKGYVDNVLAIGHLNNAQSALKKSELPAAYLPLLREVNDRIGKIKFYIVMNDLPNVQMRLNQLIGVINTLITAQGGAAGGLIVYPQNGGYQGGFNRPNPEIPASRPVNSSGNAVNLVPSNN